MRFEILRRVLRDRSQASPIPPPRGDHAGVDTAEPFDKAADNRSNAPASVMSNGMSVAWAPVAAKISASSSSSRPALLKRAQAMTCAAGPGHSQGAGRAADAARRAGDEGDTARLRAGGKGLRHGNSSDEKID